MIRRLLYRYCAWRARVWSGEATMFLQAQTIAMRARDWQEQASYRDYHAIAEAKARRWARRAQKWVTPC